MQAKHARTVADKRAKTIAKFMLHQPTITTGNAISGVAVACSEWTADQRRATQESLGEAERPQHLEYAEDKEDSGDQRIEAASLRSQPGAGNAANARQCNPRRAASHRDKH